MAATALITGASSGIGEAFARGLAKKGYDLVLVARRSDRLETLAAELQAVHQVRTDAIPCDLLAPGSIEQLQRTLAERELHIDLLVNNAGVGLHGPFGSQNDTDDARMINLNILALTRVTRAFVPDMLARGHGIIIHVASTAAFQAIPYFSVYAATKAYVLSFSQALSLELGPKGILVQCLCPGPTRSEFANHARFQTDAFERAPQQTPDAVVAESLAGLERRSHIVITGAINRWGTFLSAVLPRSVAARISGVLFAPRSK